jgi:D-arabinose 1-dehydrogenase-like Zn-dependent alcohol dehydrogenase
MKAAFVIAPRKFEIRDIKMPTMNENEMLVKIEACGLCKRGFIP